MSLGVVRDLRSPRMLETAEDARDYQEHLLAEYVLARAAHGVLDATIRQDVASVDEFLSWAAVWAWEIEPRHADKFLGDALRGRAVATRRGKATSIATFYRFLEVRYRGEIRELTGRVVISPIDAINRPAHTGDFSVRIPPSSEDLAQFFSAWRSALIEVRKYLVGARNYVMARVTVEVGLRIRELCALSLDDLHLSTVRWARSTCAWARERAVPAPESASFLCPARPARCSRGGSKRCGDSSMMIGSFPGLRCFPPKERDALGPSRFAAPCTKPRMRI